MKAIEWVLPVAIISATWMVTTHTFGASCLPDLPVANRQEINTPDTEPSSVEQHRARKAPTQIAEGGADRLMDRRVAEGGSDRLIERRVAEGGSDRLIERRVASNQYDAAMSMRMHFSMD
ncbi:hypothetical protein N8H71_00245 [Pseudomonas koreensis]|uniref:hypothetical protein n=1 Tax=Pseudomonas koreensis TaxID=198620 RepID=UPI0021CA2207|nr:hypothetical protein [Pseudomonas koreensis]MCU0069996.1 hypothetical protein [Pseudomonas koreensis]